MKLYRRDLEINERQEMHLAVDHYLTPIEIKEGWILEIIEANTTGPDYSDWELVAKAIVDKLKGEL